MILYQTEEIFQAIKSGLLHLNALGQGVVQILLQLIFKSDFVCLFIILFIYNQFLHFQLFPYLSYYIEF